MGGGVLSEEKIRQLPEQSPRVETGAVQFGSDWPGIFIRGDNAIFLSWCLKEVLKNNPDNVYAAHVEWIVRIIDEDVNRHSGWPLVQ